jgi:small subunit ribosomal protein S20
LANHKSALKRAGQNEVRRVRNRAVKTRVKHIVKQLRGSAAQGSLENASQDLRRAASVIDKAAKKGVIHKKTASRKISRLYKLVRKTESKV